MSSLENPESSFEEARRVIATLPGVSQCASNVSLSRSNTLRVGGEAAVVVDLDTEEGVVGTLRELSERRLPWMVLGLGANVVLPDGAVPLVVLRLRGRLREFDPPSTELTAGGGASLSRIARAVTRAGYLGLEDLSGFPSTVGGAVRGNAGCYGTEIRDVLVSARVVHATGRIEVPAADELELRYRHSRLVDEPAIVTSATFALRRGDGEAALRRIEELNRVRWQALPRGRPTAGSVFKNPVDERGDTLPAGRLIEECQLKGHRCGGAAISEVHANVIVNLGGATAADVLTLMALARRGVQERHGILLEPELVLVGSLSDEWQRVSTADAEPSPGARSRPCE